MKELCAKPIFRFDPFLKKRGFNARFICAMPLLDLPCDNQSREVRDTIAIALAFVLWPSLIKRQDDREWKHLKNDRSRKTLDLSIFGLTFAQRPGIYEDFSPLPRA